MVKQPQLAALLFFALSTILTWLFIIVSPLYISKDQMWLSTAIAGGKWALQIIIALCLLKEKKRAFIKNIGWVCLAGSLLLVPYIILAKLNIASGAHLFAGSLIAAVLLMVWLYRKAVIQSAASIRYWYFWLVCLVVAISLQLTIVFHLL